MRRMNRFSSRETGESRILTGTVVSQQPGTNTVDVRVARSGNRVIRQVLVPHGAQFYQGDLILICTTQTLIGWVALTRIQDRDSYGLESSAIQQESELHPPANFTVQAVGKLIIGQWDTWAGSPVCFLLQHKADPRTSDDASTLYTRGSHFVYTASGMNETRYMRVSSLRYDVEDHKVYYSAWTSWKHATTGLTIQAVYNLAVGQMHDQDEMWTMHLLGDL
jgi:hypothetical protein